MTFILHVGISIDFRYGNQMVTPGIGWSLARTAGMPWYAGMLGWSKQTAPGVTRYVAGLLGFYLSLQVADMDAASRAYTAEAVSTLRKKFRGSTRIPQG